MICGTSVALYAILDNGICILLPVIRTSKKKKCNLKCWYYDFFPPNVLYSKISLLRSLPAEVCRSLDRLHLPTVLLPVCWFISAQKTEKLFLAWVWKAGLAALCFLFRSLLLLLLKCILPSPLLWLQPCRLATGLLWDERTRGFAFLSGLWGAAVWAIAPRYWDPREWERLRGAKDLRLWMTLQNTPVPLKKFSRKRSVDIQERTRLNDIKGCAGIWWKLKLVHKIVTIFYI